MGKFGSTRTRTRVTPVPALVGTGTVGNYPWVPVMSHHIIANTDNDHDNGDNSRTCSCPTTRQHTMQEMKGETTTWA